jgi:eukaryotic-like serine/threonine-protein kinase
MSPEAAPTQLGNYDIVVKIAEGGMGTVYKARNRISGDIVAVKVIAAHTAKNPVLLQRFEREFMAAKVLDHPNVVKAIEYCGVGPYPFLVMEFVDGESLGQRVERAGAFPEEEAVRLIVQVCEGLQRAHKQGLVHRDVKPDNILVTQEGVAKLTDMGLVKDVEGDLNLTKTGRGLGTPHYMAPEQFRNAKGVDIRGDIYSLGATLYAMVTGQVPFENASPLDCWMKKIHNEFSPPKNLNPELTDRVDWAIRRAMSAEPDRRPSSCREFVEDLTGQSRTTPTRQGYNQSPADAGADIWYLVYKDETGTTHTVKGSTEGIRKALQDQLLGDAATILVSRTKSGQFTPLMSIPEFRDLVVSPAPLPTTGGVRSSGSPDGLAKASGVIPRSGPASGRYRPQPVSPGGRDPSTPLPDGDSSSSSSRIGRSGSPAPGRVAPVAKKTPTSSASGRREIIPTSRRDDPRAETKDYSPGSTPVSQPTPTRQTPPPATRAKPSREKSSKEKGFDWTPILLVVVMLLSAVIGYLVLNR